MHVTATSPGAAAIWVGLAVIGYFMLPSRAASDEQVRLGLPVNCKLGIECFVQQMPDVDAGSGTLDPVCGQATYQGHDGWDIRLRSLGDIVQDVPVVAAADGTVLRTRDGVHDHIFDPASDLHQLHGKECGNGVVIEHKGGLSTQYCHLKRGSLLVGAGAQVRKGDRIGSIGSSGLAEFPHVHLAVRLEGKLIEPLTGKPFVQDARSCGDLSGSLLDEAAREALARTTTAILDVGLAETAPGMPGLVRSGAPPPATSRGNSTIAWVWAINVEEGSQFRIKVIGPGGEALTDHMTAALPRRKASYLAYAGRKTTPEGGSYRLAVELISGEKVIASKIRSVSVSD